MRQLLLTTTGLDSENIRSICKNILETSKSDAKAVIIPTASAEWKAKHKGAIAARHFLLDVGYKKVDFLDVEFDDPQRLFEYQFIYLNGGNPFYLLHHLKRSGADNILKKMYKNGTFVAGGSAGASVFCSDLQIVSHFAPEYELEISNDFSALNFLPFAVLPHANRYRIQDKHFDDRIAEVSKAIGQEIYCIDDGTGIFIKDDEIQFIGTE